MPRLRHVGAAHIYNAHEIEDGEEREKNIKKEIKLKLKKFALFN
jgi:hypothetical protein